MNIEKLTLKEFCDMVSDKSPVPGGGAVGAIVAAFSAALNQMVANLTVGKKKYEEYKGAMEEVLENMEYTRNRLQDIAAKDIEAFNKVMEALKMPKDDPRRSELLQNALKEAADVPFELAREARNILKYSQITSKFGNKNAISDAYSSAELAIASFRIAMYNVLINLSSIKDEEFVKKYREELQEIRNEVEGMYRSIRELIKENGFEI
ncbi:formiminotransferase-cyclodeaminase [Thermosipho melanesiensis]|uniref:Formiminotransferase-cyclodeaminase n=2 Tax=Thermosipho melanesiensis TaxID=46541 RepID=A6LMW1_THEM4|nr:cyclodeaminase/cyclohydrolase family protein [Thermosipho melanesiensis]ABR31262.1 Formiminotransferase-cyclodeaminase [Thermosipho melanesiensis BI429]APT74345.1 formiminotransferase-cyclodeaminase [Thermosipho melanesiensis]OOC36285.1 formiminotransferase-cyclodeaminase [Thermosipho melanesiensis]OOC37103.1 formiminotransferase-cyclodeaminase [Thermosipho melanesiensis]OOC37855.1 formiminotransferase-cyclodeaminase [Thermosipho melanesiensis]